MEVLVTATVTLDLIFYPPLKKQELDSDCLAWTILPLSQLL